MTYPDFIMNCIITVVALGAAVMMVLACWAMYRGIKS